MKESANGSSEIHPLTLSPADAQAMDAALLQRALPALHLANAGPHEAAPAIDPARLARAAAWLNLAASSPVSEPSADLVARTLAAVEADRLKLNPAQPPASSLQNPPRRWTHLGEIAAALVATTLLVAVLVPAVSQARSSYRRTLCATNLASVGAAFNLYAAANNHDLPSLDCPSHANWLSPDPGGHTNTANLLPLVNAYLPPERLICAGRGLPDTAAARPTPSDIQNCSYSYINLFGPHKPSWNGRADTIILADKNPLFIAPGPHDANLNSPNHNQNGNYLLHADAHATWETSPNCGPAKDNIWTLGAGPNRTLQYIGTEVAASPSDVFLAP